MKSVNKRTIQFKVYLTLDEKKVLTQEFEKERFASLSQFARNRLLKKRLQKHITISADYYQVFRSLDYQVAKLGNNMNQIAHNLNAYSTYMLDEKDKERIKECYQLHKELVSVLSKYMELIRQ